MLRRVDARLLLLAQLGDAPCAGERDPELRVIVSTVDVQRPRPVGSCIDRSRECLCSAIGSFSGSAIECRAPFSALKATAASRDFAALLP